MSVTSGASPTATSGSVYATCAANAANAAWWPILAQAAISYAVEVLEEGAEVPMHAQRLNLAVILLRDADSGMRIAPAMANLGLSIESSDAELDMAVAGLWDYWAATYGS